MSQELSKLMAAKRQSINADIKLYKHKLKMKDISVDVASFCNKRIENLFIDLKFYKPSATPVNVCGVIVNGKFLEEIIKKLRRLEYSIFEEKGKLVIQYSDQKLKGRFVLEDISHRYEGWPIPVKELVN